MFVPQRIGLFYGVPLTGRSVSHIAISLGKALESFGRNIEYFSIDASREILSGRNVHVLPRFVVRAMYKLGRNPLPLAERLVFCKRNLFDLLYLWPGTSPGFRSRLIRSGVPFIYEMINCAAVVRREILTSMVRDEDLPPNGRVPEQSEVEAEAALFSAAHAIFAPSSLVANSLLTAGVAREKIISSSYGFSPDRISYGATRDRGIRNFLFVGMDSWRKGLQTLLRAWHPAPRDCRLHLVGEIDPEMKQRFRVELASDSVKCWGHCDNPDAVFRQCDAFVFPTFEEGSPLVVYESLAAGLPVITTAMGAGDIVTHEREGLIIPAGNSDALREAMLRLVESREIGAIMSLNAAQRSKAFTWDQVAERRNRQLISMGI